MRNSFDIRHLTDVAARLARDHGGVMIQIRLETQQPPTGTVMAGDDGEPVSFVGWLGLLRVLSELFDTVQP